MIFKYGAGKSQNHKFCVLRANESRVIDHLVANLVFSDNFGSVLKSFALLILVHSELEEKLLRRLATFKVFKFVKIPGNLKSQFGKGTFGKFGL